VGDHGLSIGQGEGHGLFDEDVFASLGGGNGLGGVLAAGCAETDDVNGRIGQKLLVCPARYTKSMANGSKSGRHVMADSHQASPQMGIGSDGLPVVIGDHARA
jgi:hypothetical protein